MEGFRLDKGIVNSWQETPEGYLLKQNLGGNLG